MQTLYLIRHGETEWSLTGRHTGRTDIPLTDRGESQARALATLLRSIAFTRVLTSPRLRARQTCALAGLSEDASIEDDLAEWNYGDDEGRTSAEISRERPDWIPFRDGFQNGETPTQIGARADRLIAKFRSGTGTVALFTHAHIGAVIAARWIGLPPRAGEHFPLATSSVSILAADPKRPDIPIIRQWNRTPDTLR
jgi:broad specificity phosphatase PhoE